MFKFQAFSTFYVFASTRVMDQLRNKYFSVLPENLGIYAFNYNACQNPKRPTINAHFLTSRPWW